MALPMAHPTAQNTHSMDEGIDFSRADELVFGSQPLPPAEDPDAVKKAGNAAFKLGKLEDALRLYSHLLGLSCDSTMVATTRSNRAAVYLKLGRFDEAEADASFVVDTRKKSSLKDRQDSSTVPASILAKALHRRATARAELGRLSEAIIDLEHVLVIEPRNKESREKLLQLKEQRGSSSCQSLQLEKSSQSNLVPLKEQQDHPSASNVQPSPSNHSVEPISSQENLQAALQAVQQLPVPPPSTGYEFEAAWKSARRNIRQRRTILFSIEPTSLPRFMQHLLTSDVIREFVEALSCEGPSDETTGSRVCALLDSVRHTSRFDMITMFLSSTEKRAINLGFDKLEQEYPVALAKLRSIRRSYVGST